MFMKLDVILSYVLSFLEGALSGVCFYRAGQEKEEQPKVLLYMASAVWFALSVLEGMEGTRALREARMTDPGEEEMPA